MLEAFAMTDKGCVRGNNEDYCLIEPERELTRNLLFIFPRSLPVNVDCAGARNCRSIPFIGIRTVLF